MLRPYTLILYVSPSKSAQQCLLSSIVRKINFLLIDAVLSQHVCQKHYISSNISIGYYMLHFSSLEVLFFTNCGLSLSEILLITIIQSMKSNKYGLKQQRNNPLP